MSIIKNREKHLCSESPSLLLLLLLLDEEHLNLVELLEVLHGFLVHLYWPQALEEAADGVDAAAVLRSTGVGEGVDLAGEQCASLALVYDPADQLSDIIVHLLEVAATSRGHGFLGLGAVRGVDLAPGGLEAVTQLVELPLDLRW